MGTRESHIRDERVGARGLQLGIAAAEVEQQPFYSQGGNDFPCVGDEIACRHKVSRHRQRRVLKTADRLQGKLRKIRALRKADTRSRFTRYFPSLACFWICSLCQIDQRRQIVLLLWNREARTTQGFGTVDG